MPEKADELPNRRKIVAKGKTLSEAGIESMWTVMYGEIAKRRDQDQNHGLEIYPYGAGPVVSSLLKMVIGFYRVIWNVTKICARSLSIRLNT